MFHDASKVTAQMSHLFYWTPPPTTDQHGLFPVGLPTGQSRCLHTTPYARPFPVLVSAKVRFRLVISSSSHQAWCKDRT